MNSRHDIIYQSHVAQLCKDAICICTLSLANTVEGQQKTSVSSCKCIVVLLLILVETRSWCFTYFCVPVYTLSASPKLHTSHIKKWRWFTQNIFFKIIFKVRLKARTVTFKFNLLHSILTFLHFAYPCHILVFSVCLLCPS